jgi:hypothetical protein
VTITGTNFESAATVKFGSTSASSVSFVSSTQLEATVPSISAGNYDVTVTNPDPASATLSHAFNVTDPSPPGSDGLLVGCTVSATNAVQGCSGIPSGWSLVAAEGFEGVLGPNEQLNFGTSVSSAQAHAGTKSMRETIESCTPPAGQTCSPGGWWAYTALGSGVHDVYVSWWSYLDPSARGNSDGYFAQLTKDIPGIPHDEDLLMDIQAPNGQLVTVSSLWYAPTSNDPNADCRNTSKPKTCGKYGGSWSLNLGRWEQEEVWFHPGTCNGQTPNNDGFLRMYVNGSLVYSLDRSSTFDPSPEGSGNSGGNPNGCLDMSSPSYIQVAGPWTYFVTNPVTWHKYVDDIIVMKK